MELWNKYLEYHPEIFSRLDSIDKTSRDKFLKKFKSEKDKSNFLSTLAELSFSEFFSKLKFEVEYDKSYGKFTPDLTITKDNSQVIVEVVKLNPTEKDTLRNDFESYLFDEIQKIEIGCWLEINFEEQYFDVALYNKEIIVKEVLEWLTTNCEVGNQIRLYENFVFKIIKVDKKYKHVCVMGNANSIDIDIRRLESDNSRFIKKIGKYQKLIAEFSLPYILCIKIDFHAAISEIQMFWTLYGDLSSYFDLEIHHCELNGVYYTDKDSENLSGVFLMVGDKIFYFHNFKETRLKEDIKIEFLKYQYHCNTSSKLIYLQLVPKI